MFYLLPPSHRCHNPQIEIDEKINGVRGRDRRCEHNNVRVDWHHSRGHDRKTTITWWSTVYEMENNNNNKVTIWRSLGANHVEDGGRGWWGKEEAHALDNKCSWHVWCPRDRWACVKIQAILWKCVVVYLHTIIIIYYIPSSSNISDAYT